MVASSLDPEIARWRHRPPADPADAEAYIRRRAAEWLRDERYSWAVCEPTTGEMVGEVELVGLDLERGLAELTCWALPAARGRGMTTTAVGSVVRFAFGGLGLPRVQYQGAEPNAAPARVAAKCGFRVEGRLRSAWVDDGRRTDVVISSRLPTDR